MTQSREARLIAKEELRRVIESQGRQQSWIARQLGVSKFHVSHIVAGRRSISESQAERVASLLGVPLFLLFELPDGNKNLTEAQAA